MVITQEPRFSNFIAAQPPVDNKLLHEPRWSLISAATLGGGWEAELRLWTPVCLTLVLVTPLKWDRNPLWGPELLT